MARFLQQAMSCLICLPDVRCACVQDMPSFDVGAFVVGSKPVKVRTSKHQHCASGGMVVSGGRVVLQAHLLAKTPGILAGMPFFNAVFEVCCRSCSMARYAIRTLPIVSAGAWMRSAVVCGRRVPA